AVLTEGLRGSIRTALRSRVSPRCVPDEIFSIPEVPRTSSGKKLEVPVKQVLRGVPVEEAVGGGAIANPQSIHYFVDLARTLAASPPSRHRKGAAMAQHGTFYTATYGNFAAPFLEEIRAHTYGEDIGQNSWLTADEHRRFLSLLELSADSAVLDVGSGSGG